MNSPHNDPSPITQAELLRKIGRRIRAYRKQKKWTQLDLAVHTQNHRTQISRIERGEHNLQIYSLEIIARALEVRLADLLPEAGKVGGTDKQEQIFRGE